MVTWVGNNSNNVKSGTSGADKLSGRGGNDTLRGLAENDSLYGEAGNDLLDGGLGNDSMTGGPGNDTYIVNKSPTSGTFQNTPLSISADGQASYFDIPNTAVPSGWGEGYGSTRGQLGVTFDLSPPAQSVSLSSAGQTASATIGALGFSEADSNGDGLAYIFPIEGRGIAGGVTNGKGLEWSLSLDLTVGGTARTVTFKPTVSAEPGYVQDVSSHSPDQTVVDWSSSFASQITTFGNGGKLLVDVKDIAFTHEGDSAALEVQFTLLRPSYDYRFTNVPGDQVIEASNGGTDTVRTTANNYVLPLNVEHVRLEGANALTAWGNSRNNDMIGNDKANTLFGLAGNDRLFGGLGDDTLLAGSGNDVLGGSVGRDELWGGSGPDRFDYDFVEHSPSEKFFSGVDRIMDFSQSQGDRIDFSAMDANQTASAPGSQDFIFIGPAAFTAPGQIRYELDEKFGETLVYANVDADLEEDATIVVNGLVPFSELNILV